MTAAVHQLHNDNSLSLRTTMRDLGLQEWIDDDSVQEITVNRPGEAYLRRGIDWHLVGAPQLTYDRLEMLCTQVSAYTKIDFDENTPELSGTLPDGQRIELTRPPACLADHILVNIRCGVDLALSFEDCIQQGYFSRTRHLTSVSLSAADRQRLLPLLDELQLDLWNLAQKGHWEAFFRRAVVDKQNILISGSTGSGKTAFIRALINLLPPYVRCLTVEDTHETPLPHHRNSQALFFKRAGDSAGMTAKEALAATMRKTGDRIFLSELRSDECFFYIQTVLNSGHSGGMSTTHANNPREAFLRLAMLIKASPEGATIPYEEIRKILYSQVHVVAQLVFDRQHGRHVSAVFYDPLYILSLMD